MKLYLVVYDAMGTGSMGEALIVAESVQQVLELFDYRTPTGLRRRIDRILEVPLDRARKVAEGHLHIDLSEVEVKWEWLQATLQRARQRLMNFAADRGEIT